MLGSSGCVRFAAVVAAAGLTAWAFADFQSGGVPALEKKLIEYGWDVPFTDYVRDNIRAMEQRPFDGLIFKLRGGMDVLDPKPWDEAKLQPDYDAAPAIRWERFTDNFVILWAASDQDWFNDEHWQTIEHNVRLATRAAKLAKCVGICFDPEPYGTDPWLYTQAAHRDTKSFADYEQMVRRRGAQFARAMTAEMPELKVLTFFQLSLFPDLLKPMAPEERAAKLSAHHYGLLPSFLNGMLEGGGTKVTIIDGNESAYYYTERLPYFEVYQCVTQRGRLLIDPALWGLYRTQMQVGQALYIDQYYGLRGDTKTYGSFMDPADQSKWFEHNVYWALYTTDEYVWCYSERMNWWKNENVPAGCEEAIRSARQKVEKGQSLGFDLKPIIDKARERQRTEETSRIKQQRAEIGRLPAGVPAPKIDGVLDDEAWKRVAPLEPFALLASTPERPIAETRAWVTYDDRALYVAFRCQEPRPDQMTVVGEGDDALLWQGDDVELMVSEPGKMVPFYHFMVNPRGAYWDSINDGETDDPTYNPEWQHAATVGEDSWAAEMAIPWSAMKMPAPKPGSELHADLCRQRIQGHELSAWSPMLSGFLEADLFGTWVLG